VIGDEQASAAGHKADRAAGPKASEANPKGHATGFPEERRLDGGAEGGGGATEIEQLRAAAAGDRHRQ
jgi:hypothetical protein